MLNPRIDGKWKDLKYPCYKGFQDPNKKLSGAEGTAGEMLKTTPPDSSALRWFGGKGAQLMSQGQFVGALVSFRLGASNDSARKMRLIHVGLNLLEEDLVRRISPAQSSCPPAP